MRSAGDAAGAEKALREALAIDAAAAGIHERLALLLTGEAHFEEALVHFRAGYAAGALSAAALADFVRVLLERCEHVEAGQIAEAAAEAHADSAQSWFALGLARLSAHRYADALAAFDRALGLDAPDAERLTYRAIALQNLGRLAEAVDAHDRALALTPEFALAGFHKSLALLSSGQYGAAWPEYEARLASAGLAPRPRRYTRWDGVARGHRLLVYGEQGLGDEIMFASCLPDLLRSGQRCVVECNPALQRLFERSFPQALVYAAAPDKDVPERIHALGIGAEVPLGSLPLLYRPSEAAFPRHEGYLLADAQRVESWRARLRSLGPGLAIGISWKGGTHASRAPLRSLTLSEWLPVLRTPGARFVSLQYTAEAAAELRAFEAETGIHIEHWPEAIADYDETAALVCALDLTVSVCTSVVHLAGALGHPVWVLAPKNAEWRYGSAGEAMPWYPSARLFRQTREGAWGEVVDAVARRLREADVWNSAGIRRLSARDFPHAEHLFEQALEHSPGRPEVHTNLGIALIEQGADAAGERHLRAAIALDPGLTAARQNLAELLSARFEHDAALAAWNEVLALDPQHAGAHMAIAFLAAREGRLDDARTLYRRAVELGADRAMVLAKEAGMLAAAGDAEAAARLWADIGESASSPEILWERALSALAAGAYAEGWPLYEARLDRVISPRRPYSFPEWDGTPLADGALLILGEQGLGDEIMFASCYEEAMARVPRCVIECEPRLSALFRRSFPAAHIVAQDRQGASDTVLASADIARQIHAGSLPRLFRATRAAFPPHTGYLVADEERAAAWRKKLDGGLERRLVGIAWRGGVLQTRRSLRSLAPADFARMLSVPGIEFVSLQHDDDGATAKEIAELAGVRIHSFRETLADIDDTAALVKSLDGVLTVCSTVVHLAGALGAPALVLTPSLPEWRYLRAGATSPWYPSVRLLRQPERDRWDGVIEAARARLLAFAAGGSLITDD
jgi:tetratricopeptide (TPR) repeat protein